MKAGKTKADFYDYDAYVAKFQRTDLPRTTDETYTPEDVYNCVVDYVDTIYPLEGHVVVRPFYPGGDYQAYNYPPNGVVIDNPPFSILTQIVRYYIGRGIPFFLFAPHVTCSSLVRLGATVFFVEHGLRYSNGAEIGAAFVSNLTPQWAVVCASSLRRALADQPSQQPSKKSLKIYDYPHNLLKFSEFSALSFLEEDTAFPRASVVCTRARCEGRSVGFSGAFLLSDEMAKLARAKLARAKLARTKLARAKLAHKIELTEEQQQQLRVLNQAAKQ